MERLEKIQAALSESEYDAILAVGADNFAYLTGAVLPFAEHYPTRWAGVLLSKGGERVVMLPQDWSQAVKDQGWRGETLVYDENRGVEDEGFSQMVQEVVIGLGLESKRIGLDTYRASKQLVGHLAKGLPKAEWASADPMLRDLRIRKTQEEVAYIEKACKQVDRGIVYALMHLEGAVANPGYTVAEFTERVRVHIFENGASGVGLLNSAFGNEGQFYYTPQRGWVEEGVLFRVDASAHYKGYWANIGRMGVTGDPTPEQEEAYQDNLRLKEEALTILKPGVSCNEVFAHVTRVAEKKAIQMWREPGIGHGVGASHHEAPYLTLNCSIELKEGMVVALDIYTFGPHRELVHSKDVYVITEEGSRRLSWYRSWDKLYHVYGWRATH